MYVQRGLGNSEHSSAKPSPYMLGTFAVDSMYVELGTMDLPTAQSFHFFFLFALIINEWKSQPS